jgi:hypothetical protein
MLEQLQRMFEHTKSANLTTDEQRAMFAGLIGRLSNHVKPEAFDMCVDESIRFVLRERRAIEESRLTLA